MTETQTEASQSLNGSDPGQAGQEPAAGPCEDCATSGEKILAIVAALFGAFVIAMAIDMFTGGKLSGFVKERQGE
jgi:hypothetical protein